MTFRVVTRERRATQHNGHANVQLIQLLQISLHHRHAFHKQAAHANGVGAGGFPRVNNLLQALLNANVVNLETIVGQNDVHQILANVVHVASHGGQHNGGLGFLGNAFFCHKRLQKGHGFFHHARALQHEWKLHGACAK